MNYLTRVIRPDLLAPVCAYFDQKVIETATTKLALTTPLTNEAIVLLTQPIRLGGFGIRRMLSVSPIAFWCSTAQAGPEIATLITTRSEGKCTAPATSVSLSSPPFLQAAAAIPITRALYACHDAMCNASIKPADELMPERGSDFWRWYGEYAGSAGLQRLLVAEMENARALRLLAEAEGDPMRVARLTGIKAKLAGTWLTTLPSSPQFQLRDNHFKVAARLRLGLPPQDDLPRRCRCDYLLTQDPLHFLNCTLLKPAVTFRHDVIVRILAMLARKAGGACYVEPRFYVGIRPDIHIMFPTTKILVDVTVVHPSRPTFAPRSHVPLFAALARERDKTTKFKELSQREQAQFVPFALESFGAWGRGATKLISDIASLALESKSVAMTCEDVRGEMIRTIAIALQAGNAHVLLNGCMRAREHAGRSIPVQQQTVGGGG